MSACKNHHTETEGCDSVVDTPMYVQEYVVPEDNMEEMGKSKEAMFVSPDLDLLQLTGNVKSLSYDSLLYVGYNRSGEMTYWSLNDTVNLFDNVERDRNGGLKEWGADGWRFKVTWPDDYYNDSHKTGCLIHRIFIENPRRLRQSFVYHYKNLRPTRENWEVEMCKHVAESSNGGYKPDDVLKYDKYEYDSHGNWISRRIKSDVERTRTEKRHIQYYE